MPSLKWLRKSRRKWRLRENRFYKKWRHARARRRLRTRQIEEAKTGPARALRWAVNQIGVEENPPGSNSGPKISEWIRAGGGQPGWPWCQYFVNRMLTKVGGPQLKTGYTVAVVQWAREGRYDLKLVSLADAQPGDWVYFKFPGVSNDFCDHVGTLVRKHDNSVECVEGNTSPGTSGSQNNGGGVYRRIRPRSLVVAVVRPDYTP